MGNEEEKFGIENLKKVASLPIEIGNTIPKVVAADGTISKVRAMGSVIDEVMDLVGCDFSKVKEEWADMSDVEKKELIAFTKKKFDIENDQLEVLIEESFDLALQQIELGSKMIDLGKRFIAKG